MTDRYNQNAFLVYFNEGKPTLIITEFDIGRVAERNRAATKIERLDIAFILEGGDLEMGKTP